MNQSETNTFDDKKRTKRVRFDEQVNIVEIQPIDRSNPKEMGNDASSKDDSDEDSSFRYNGALTPCNFSNTNNRNKKFRPIKRPSRIPSNLFNTMPLPLPSEVEGFPITTTNDLRWNSPKTARSKSKKVAPSIPIRVPSINSILEDAIKVVGNLQTSSTDIDQDLSACQNQSWNGQDYGFNARVDYKRWIEDCPPAIPLRRTSSASLENCARRKFSCRTRTL